MNIKKLNNSIEMLKEFLGPSLLACDIWILGTGQSIAGHNSQPKATALFDQVTEYLRKALSSSGFPPISRYYMLDLGNEALVVVLNFDKYQWGMLVNKNKVQLGLLLNIIIPNISEEFEEAMKG